MAAEGKFLLPPLVYASSEKRIGQEKNFFRKCAVFNIHLIFAHYTAIVKRENPRIKKPINLHFIYLQPQAAEGLCLSPLVLFCNIKQAGETGLSFHRFVLCRAKQIIGGYIENFTQLFDGLDIGFRASLLPACISVHGYFQHLGYLSLRQAPLFADNK